MRGSRFWRTWNSRYQSNSSIMAVSFWHEPKLEADRLKLGRQPALSFWSPVIVRRIGDPIGTTPLFARSLAFDL